MAYINFKNLPDTTTPLNATNMNDIQDGLIRKIEFTVSANSTKTITISDDNIKVFIFNARAGISSGYLTSLFSCYGVGGSARYKEEILMTGTTTPTITIGAENTRTISIQDTNNRNWTCSIVVLLGDISKITIS